MSFDTSFAKAIFGDLKIYYALVGFLPQFISIAGLNSEATMSRAMFEKALIKLAGTAYLNQFLYFYDCQKLLTGIQECTKEAIHLQGEFYRALNLEELFCPKISEKDGVNFMSSAVTTKIVAVINFIFIRLYSLLDYMTKLVFEIEHLKTDCSIYPRLSSAKISFGQRRRIGLNGKPNTLFEACVLINEIESIRHLIIHDGFLDDMPKVYKVVQSGVTIEKFLLMPDRVDGRLEKFNNRNLFYSGEDKINLRLPELLNSFQARQIVTLNLALEQLNRIAEMRKVSAYPC